MSELNSSEPNEKVNLFELLDKTAESDATNDEERISEQVDIEKLSNELLKAAERKEMQDNAKEAEGAVLDKIAEAAAIWEVLKDEGVL